jgi:hypothetical protein
MARDNANAVEQLKASQDQMARAIAKASETKTDSKALDAKASAQNVRPKMSGPPLRQTATPTHRPVPAHPLPPATARP